MISRTGGSATMEDTLRILVVDDEETIRGILSRVLGEEGYKVTLAESGEEALEIFGKDPHPLVLTDIRMGGMSGMELLTEIRGINSETQVLMNLVINAQQALDGQRGTVRIVTSLSSPDQVEIRVSDTGPGIPEEIQSKLFEPFFTTKPAGKGTGLGLSVTYGIIRDHKGEIRVESKPGEG
ncbi:MAG: response regulator, partial [Deltaproteobacteria bacterium]|nr:response regulator [Deltaproteobacteria bacterium]